MSSDKWPIRPSDLRAFSESPRKFAFDRVHLTQGGFSELNAEARRLMEEAWDVAPGGKKAIENGCTCPAEENSHGKGSEVMIGHDHVTYVVEPECPRHGPALQANFTLFHTETVSRKP